MTVGLGAFPWADSNKVPQLAGSTDNMPVRDKGWLWRWGPVPLLGYAWQQGHWLPDNWRWLARAGFRRLNLRLWYAGSSDNPQPFPEPRQAVDMMYEKVNSAISCGGDANLGTMDVVACVDNEPDLEHTDSPHDYEIKIRGFVAEWRERFPNVPLASFSIAQNSPRSGEFLSVLQRTSPLWDYIRCHFYVQKEADKQPGVLWSPEWYHSLFPDKPIIVSEFGNQVNKHDVAELARRYTRYPWLDSYHLFIMSHPSGFPEATFDDDMANIAFELCRDWRAVRSYPRGATVVQPQPQPADNLEHVRVMRSLARRQRQQVQAALDALGSIDSDAQEVIDRAAMAGVK